MVTKAVELANAHGWFLTRQFENEANADIHSRTTAREIIEDFRGEKLIHRVIAVPAAEAIRYSRELARKEGIFVGITAGATFAGALRVCAEAQKNANVLCMLPDTGERYLSTPMFADVQADMSQEELDISRSTPSAQFDA